MKRSRSSPSSPLDRKIQRLPSDLHTAILSKIPAHTQKRVNKAQYELTRLRALVFRDFLKELVSQQEKDFTIEFVNDGADEYEVKKTFIVSKAILSPRSSLDRSYEDTDAPGEYTLNVRQVHPKNVDIYASNLFENVATTTAIKCTGNVMPQVKEFAEKLFPNLPQIKTLVSGGRKKKGR